MPRKIKYIDQSNCHIKNKQKVRFGNTTIPIRVQEKKQEVCK